MLGDEALLVMAEEEHRVDDVNVMFGIVDQEA
jgi:hypothetical protein